MVSISLLAVSQSLEAIFIACGIVSVLGSLSIVVTCLVFPALISEGHIYMQILLLISISDFCACLVFSLGFVTNPTLCAIQGGSLIFFFRATWFWTLAFTYQLYYLVKNNDNKPPAITFRSLNAIIWGVNVVIEFIPLFMPHGVKNFEENVAYGTDDANYGDMICTFKRYPSLETTNDMMIAMLFVPFVIVLVGMVVLWIRVYLHFRHESALLEQMNIPLLQAHDLEGFHNSRTNEDQSSLLDDEYDVHALSITSDSAEQTSASNQLRLDKLSSITSVLLKYPLALFVCWTPLFISFLASDGLSGVGSGDDTVETRPWKFIEVFSIPLASLHGVVLAAIFFIHAPRARQLWMHRLKTYYPRFHHWCCKCCSASLETDNEAVFNPNRK